MAGKSATRKLSLPGLAALVIAGATGATAFSTEQRSSGRGGTTVITASPEKSSGKTTTLSSPPTTPGEKPDTVALDPKTEEAAFHFKVGQVALKNDDLTIAAKEFGEAARLAPSNALAWYNLGIVESKRDNSTIAVEHMRKALKLGLPTKERSAAEDVIAESTYRGMKTGADVPNLMYGLGFGLTVEQVRARGLELGSREASRFGARYDLYSRDDAPGNEETVSLYFGNDGLQRIWVDFGQVGFFPGAEKDFFAIEQLLRSRGFNPSLREELPREFRVNGNPMPQTLTLRKHDVYAGILLEFRFTGPAIESLFLENMKLVIFDSGRCPTTTCRSQAR